ncbi:MAG: hypothetical protein WCK02_14265 [Bacteroidota bacterium]
MNNNRKKIGEINYQGQNFKVFWEIDTKLVWVFDYTGYWSNFCNASADNEDSVLDCATEMLRKSGQQINS